MIRRTAVASGHVQDVGYRYFVSGCARETGIVGYVRNEPDGTVLIVAEGSGEVLDVFFLMIRAAHDHAIQVENITVTPGEATGEFPRFSIRW